MTALIEVHLAPHGKEYYPAIKGSIRRVEEVLQKTSGKTYFMLENASISTPVATNIETLIDMGVRPPIAFGFGQTTVDPQTVRFLTELNLDDQRMKRLSQALGNTSTTKELMDLDKLYTQYRDPTGKSRLSVLFESTANRKGALNVNNFQRNEKKIRRWVASANFSAALDLFKHNTKNMAEDAQAREELITKKVYDHLADDVAAIFIKFGACHTGIYQRLKQMGLPNVSKIFFDGEKPTNTYYFDPTSAAIRKVMFHGFESVTEVEWYKAVIGDMMLATLHTLHTNNKKRNGGMNEQHMIKVVSSEAQLFETLEDVEKFRGNVQKEGIINAFLELGR